MLKVDLKVELKVELKVVQWVSERAKRDSMGVPKTVTPLSTKGLTKVRAKGRSNAKAKARALLSPVRSFLFPTAQMSNQPTRNIHTSWSIKRKGKSVCVCCVIEHARERGDKVACSEKDCRKTFHCKT